MNTISCPSGEKSSAPSAVSDETKEWLQKNLKLETSPEKSGITNLRKTYMEFLGLALKLVNRSASISPKASTKKRVWTCTSRVKRKTLSKLKEKLVEEGDKLASVPKSYAKKAVEKDNSVVRGMHNYFSLASQISKDFGGIQKDLTVHMFHKIKGLKKKPKEFKPKIMIGNF